MMIRYKKGYKYQLQDTEVFETLITGQEAETSHLTLTKSGALIIKSGYAWDGPSGLTFDTKSSMIGSLVHDALYELLRGEYLPLRYRLTADNLLYELCVASGMYKWRARSWYRAVRLLASPAADPRHRKRIHEVKLDGKS